MRQQDARSGTIHHVRRNLRKDPDRYFYDERDHSRVSPALYGRSVVARLSAGEAARVQGSIRDYARDDANMPRVSRQTNCQTFVGGTLGHLERDGLLRSGHSQYFSQFYGQRSVDIERQMRQDGRHFYRPERDGAPATVVAEHRDRSEPSPRSRLMNRYRDQSR